MKKIIFKWKILYLQKTCVPLKFDNLSKLKYLFTLYDLLTTMYCKIIFMKISNCSFTNDDVCIQFILFNFIY